MDCTIKEVPLPVNVVSLEMTIAEAQTLCGFFGGSDFKLNQALGRPYQALDYALRSYYDDKGNRAKGHSLNDKINYNL